MGWYAHDRVIRYRRSIPMWADANLEGLAASAISGCLIAAVRSATVGMPIEETATAPFMEGKWLFSHNGRVPGEALTGLKAHEAESTCDSAKLAAGVFALGRLGWSLGDAIAEVTTTAGGADAEARVNLLATDGQTIAATTWGDTLFVRSLPEGVLVASEPLDDRDDGWVRTRLQPSARKSLKIYARSGLWGSFRSAPDGRFFRTFLIFGGSNPLLRTSCFCLAKPLEVPDGP
jgi:glutamine amidotransferase